jgi:glutamyl-tRNA synthetase
LPLHALIIRAFGWEEPIWVHLSLFLKPSGKGQMSKRDSADAAKDGHSIFLKDMRELGYLPEGVANWTALMGWSYDERTEFFTLQDLIDKFSLGKLNPAPAAINFSKLDHFNGLHIRALSSDDLAERLEPYFRDAGLDADLPTLRKIAPIIQERMITLNDGPEIAGFFFRESVQPEPEDLIAKGLTVEQSAEVARRAYQILSAVASLEAAVAEPPMRDLVDEMGMKAAQVFGILRIAVTGQRVSPPLFESMEIIGKQVVLERLQTAITILEGQIEQG